MFGVRRMLGVSPDSSSVLVPVCLVHLFELALSASYPTMSRSAMTMSGSDMIMSDPDMIMSDPDMIMTHPKMIMSDPDSDPEDISGIIPELSWNYPGITGGIIKRL